MTALEWDQVGVRRYETGIDRGVLYIPGGNAVAWNGLTSVTENMSREVKNYYIDGIQYLAHHVPGGFSGKIQAFTYPDELDELLGVTEFTVPGVFMHDQRAKMFNLSYRTLIGNDVDGTDHGYRIHILYNVLATPSDRTFNSIGESVDPQVFEWNLVGVPSAMLGARPTSHISMDSRRIDPGLLNMVEENLYGSEFADAGIPPAVDFLNMMQFWGSEVIT